MATIKELKKGDRFRFNGKLYEVSRKYINEDKPLCAKRTDVFLAPMTRFDHDGLEVEKI